MHIDVCCVFWQNHIHKIKMYDLMLICDFAYSAINIHILLEFKHVAQDQLDLINFSLHI